jgi:uncharacterized membrane-anchored protein
VKAPEDDRDAPPAADAETSRAQALAGLTDARTIALERYAIRTRENGVTRAAWRLEVESAQGPGAIVLVDVDADADAQAAQSHYRGEGVFLGWPRERLEAAYLALRPMDSSPPLELSQLG